MILDVKRINAGDSTLISCVRYPFLSTNLLLNYSADISPFKALGNEIEPCTQAWQTKDQGAECLIVCLIMKCLRDIYQTYPSSSASTSTCSLFATIAGLFLATVGTRALIISPSIPIICAAF